MSELEFARKAYEKIWWSPNASPEQVLKAKNRYIAALKARNGKREGVNNEEDDN